MSRARGGRGKAHHRPAPPAAASAAARSPAVAPGAQSASYGSTTWVTEDDASQVTAASGVKRREVRVRRMAVC
jgi:hypothetical protein